MASQLASAYMQRLADMLTEFSRRHESEQVRTNIAIFALLRILHIQIHDTFRRVLKLRWRTGNPWLLDCCDEVAGREELDHCDEKAGRYGAILTDL